MNTGRGSRGCKQCRDLIDVLQQQISQLQSRQTALKKLNNTLIQNLSIPIQSPHSSLNCEEWKHKYEREVQRSCRLERQIMQMQIQSQMQRKSVEKRKQRQNVTKLNNLIMSTKFQGLQNCINGNGDTFCTVKKAKRNSFYGGARRDKQNDMDWLTSGKELVVRIVR